MPDADEGAPRAIVVMGVCGSGKTATAEALAPLVGVSRVLDADDFHSAEAVAKMSSGTPLTDEDRWPWLRRLGVELAAQGGGGGGTLLACSALKASYREVLASALPASVGLEVVYLSPTRETLMQRLEARGGHFMPSSLLDSQLATLEPPTVEEAAIAKLVAVPADAIAACDSAAAVATYVAEQLAQQQRS